MKTFSRRKMLKTGILAPAIAAAAAHGITPIEAAMLVTDRDSPLSAAESARADAARSAALTAAGRDRLLLDFDWRFHLGDTHNAANDFGFGVGRMGNFQKTGDYLPPSAFAFDDGDWKPVDLPHDWAVELPFQNDPALQSKGFYPLGRNYPATSVGWYRRVFELPATDAGKRISLEFDGVYRDAIVAVNGSYVGRHTGGYDSFRFDITDFVNVGGRNVLALRVDATLNDGWFYEGAGIYRHVWLVKTSPVHVKQWGTFVRSDVRNGKATVSVMTEVNNHTNSSQQVRVLSLVIDPSGALKGKTESVLETIDEGGEHAFETQIPIYNPQLWSLEERNLYRLLTEVELGGKIVDRYETRFGIRSVRFDSRNGLLLNGKPVKVKGTCNHQDHAGLGVALPDAVQYYRVRKLQEMGCNALRISHNPPTTELLDACDELGMLVLDETRMMSSNPEGLSQFENLVRRDRNHPSVFMWSMGNEEGTANTERGVPILTAMKAVATRHDGSRPVTIAPAGAVGTGGLEVCDVIGYNYMDPVAEAYHEAHPDHPVIGTETVSAVGTRGIYVTDFNKGFVASYDPYTTTGRASAEGWWRFCNSRSWLAGGFIWTGFDYRGEPSPNGWPNISSQYGIIDTCGFPKDSFFYYQSWWTTKPVLHLFPHWNWPGLDGKEIAVWVYSNLDRVELFLNGQSLGMKEMKKDSHLAWNVTYVSGVIEARGYKDDKLVLTAKRETTGQPASLVLTTDRSEISADREDVAMFAVEVRDAQGRVVPITDNTITFQITGSGKLIGVGNGDPTDLASDKGTSRKAFGGYGMALVQATKSAGTITVEATSPGLSPATATITTKTVTLRPQIAAWKRTVPDGPGVTGLWRPLNDDTQIFTLLQNGNDLKGTVEAIGLVWAGGFDTPLPVVDGNIDGRNISFKVANYSFSGRVNGDIIELERIPTPRSHPQRAEVQAEAPQPAIGPPPDGSDPSSSPHSSHPVRVLLRRAQK